MSEPDDIEHLTKTLRRLNALRDDLGIIGESGSGELRAHFRMVSARLLPIRLLIEQVVENLDADTDGGDDAST